MVNGGAFVIPVLHEITPVNMNVMRIEVRREDGAALITQNRMRVDLIAEFFVRVGAEPASWSPPPRRRSAAARCSRTGIRDLLEGKFACALRTVAAQMTLEEMHEQRGDYAARVRELGVGVARPQRARARERGASSTSTRPASNISIRPTPSTPRA